MTGARGRKVAENELALENVVKRVGQLGRSDATVAVICECRRADCRATLDVPFRAYARTRSADPRRFLLAVDHESPALDAIVESLNGYVLVEER